MTSRHRWELRYRPTHTQPRAVKCNEHRKLFELKLGVINNKIQYFHTFQQPVIESVSISTFLRYI
jgi:hypothetical protein